MVLTYINPLNKNYKGEVGYEFIFSKDIDIDFGENWDVCPASAGEVTPPPIKDILGVVTLKTTLFELDLAMQSDNFSMYDAAERVIALGWEKTSPDGEERLVFHYGDEFETVKKRFYSRDIKIELDKPN